MCGLTLSLRLLSLEQDGSEAPPDPLLDSLIASNARRGPDSCETFRKVITTDDGSRVELVLAASVLGLRGDGVTVQPLIGRRGVLGWNGQVFAGMNMTQGENDTRRVFQKLEDGEKPWELLSEVEGPFAFIYLDLIDMRLYFQLDPLSRRSLLLHEPDSSRPAYSDRFILSSSRSSAAREAGVGMRALNGGEGGSIDLKLIRGGRPSPRTSYASLASDKQNTTDIQSLDLSNALQMHTCLPVPVVTPLITVAPVNRALPILAPSAPSSTIQDFLLQLTEAVRRRVDNIPSRPPGVSRVALLFSGGVDCTLLAGVLHRVLPPDEPVELINVAFERPPAAAHSQPARKTNAPGFAAVNEQDWLVPDRVSGLDALDELQNTCPREWRFVAVNVSYEVSQTHRQAVLDLMYPSATEMDLSLAFPLYFASRGMGRLDSLSGPKEYTVQSKVYLSGLGADEQLGGYSRHRRAYEMGGWQGLIDEIQLDIDRLPERNLSRDDRIISSHARDARYPYLDLAFVGYLSSLPMWQKCNFASTANTDEGSYGPGSGDKMLLRLAAREIGLERASRRVKRAMQFGTRSSKIGSGAKGPGAGSQLVG